MAMQTEMRANIVAGVDKASFNDGINYARDTGKKIDQALKAKLELDLAGFQLKLDDARRSLRDAKKLGDENLRYKAQLDVNSLTSSVTYAKGQLENLKATGDKDTSRLQLKFNMLAEEARKMGQEISRVGLSINQVASLDKKLNDVDNAFKKGTISASQYNAEIKKISDETRRLQGQKGGLGEIGNILVGAGLVSGISAVSNSIVTLAGNLEQARISFGVMLGSAEKADVLLKDLSEFAKKTPFELVGLREQAKLLKGYGFETEQIIPTLDKLGNISAGVGRDKLPRLVYALAQVRAAGRLTGQDMRQFTETGVGLGAELEKITGIAGIHSGNVAEIGITYQQVEQALTNLTAKGGQYAGLMEAQSKTLQGVRSNFKDSMNILGEQIGSLFLPILTTLARGFASVAQSISNASQQFPFLTKVVGSLIALFGLFVAGLGAYTAILPIATALTKVLGISMTTLGSAITFALGPISLIIAGLYALTKAYQSNFLGFQDFVDGFVSKAKIMYEVGKLVFEGISQSISSFVSDIRFLADIVSNVIGFIVGNFGALGRVKSIVTDVFGFIGSFIKQQVFGIYYQIGQLLSLLGKIPGIKGLIDKARINATDQSQFGPKAYDPSGGLAKNVDISSSAVTKSLGGGGKGGSTANKEKQELDARIKAINDEADARILALSRTKKSREKNAQEIIDIDRKREEAIKEIQGKSADIQIDKAKKVVEEAKKNFETTKSSAEKAFDEVSKAIDKSADSVKKLNDDLKAVNDSLAEIDQTIGSRVVAIEQELADTNLSYEQRRKLEEELALAKSSITSEELAKAREEEAKSETQKLLDKRTVLEEKKKQLEDELAFEKTISENLATAKIDLEKKIADAHEAELERQKDATTIYANSVIEMYKQIEIAAKKASEAGSAVFGGGTIPGRAVGGPVSAGSPYIVGEKGPEMFVPHNSGTIIPNNVLNNNINVNANVANGIDMDVLANTLAHKIALTRKGVF